MIALHDKGFLAVNQNQFFNIGKLDISDFSEMIPNEIISNYDDYSPQDYNILSIPVSTDNDNSEKFLFEKQILKISQEVGVFIVTSTKLDVYTIHKFTNNVFQDICAQFSGIYYFSGSYGSTRALITNNFYKRVYGLDSGVLQVTIDNDISYSNIRNPYYVGLIKMQDELISDSRAIKGGIIRAKSKAQYLSILIFNTKFNKNSQTQLNFESATFHMINCEFTSIDDAQFDDKLLSDTVTTDAEFDIDLPESVLMSQFEQDLVKQMFEEASFSNSILKTTNSKNQWITKMASNQFNSQSINFEESLLWNDDSLFGLFDISDSDIAQKNQIINCIITGLQGDSPTMFEMAELSSLFIKNSEISNNKGGVFEVSDFSILKIIDSNINNQKAQIIGSFIKSYPGQISLKNLTISDFKSSGQPLMYISGFKSFLDINNCIFKDLEAESLMNSENNLDGQITVYNSIFINSQFESSLISLSYSTMNISESHFRRVYGQQITNGFNLINSNLYVTGITVDNRPLLTTNEDYLQMVDFGFFNVIQGSYLYLTKSKFSQLLGQIASLMYISRGGEAEVSKCEITNFEKQYGEIIEYEDVGAVIVLSQIEKASFDQIYLTNVNLRAFRVAFVENFQISNSRFDYDWTILDQFQSSLRSSNADELEASPNPWKSEQLWTDVDDQLSIWENVGIPETIQANILAEAINESSDSDQIDESITDDSESDSTLDEDTQTENDGTQYDTATDEAQIDLEESSQVGASYEELPPFLDPDQFKEFAVNNWDEQEFNKRQCPYIWLQTSKATIDGVTFQNNDMVIGDENFGPAAAPGIGVHCDESYTEVTIRNSLFKNLYSRNAPAINSDQNTKNIFISNSIFQDNVAQGLGGAIMLFSISNSTISHNSQFINNKAMSGGAIFFVCIKSGEADTYPECEFEIDDSVTFKDNYAYVEGGAIQIKSADVTFVDKSKNFDNNKAEDYANNYGSFTTAINVYFNDSVNALIPKPNLLQLTGDAQQIVEIASGQRQHFQVDLLDIEGDIVRSDTSTKARIIAASSDHNQENFKVTDNEVMCDLGVCHFDEINFQLQPLQSVDMLVEIEVSEVNEIEKEFEKYPMIFTLHSRSCESGERMTEKGECLVCQEGQFLLEPATEATAQCKDCLSMAFCKGGNRISPRAGWWRANLTSEDFVKCLRSSSCLDTDTIDSIDNYMAKCDVGYQGKLCGECQNGYVRRPLMVCQKCASWTKEINKALLLLLQIFLMIYLLSYLNMKNADTTKPTFQVLIKMIFNHMTILGAVESINYGYPEFITKILDVVRQVVAAVSRSVNYECLTLGSTGVHDPEFSIHFKNLIISCFMPFITTALCYMAFLVQSAIKNLQKAPDMVFREANNNSLCSLVVALWIFYPDICTFVFRSFVCYEVEGQKYLLADFSMVCWEGQHLNYAFLIALPALIFLVIGIPAWMFKALKANDDLIKKITQECQEQDREMNRNEKQELRDYKMRYGFLYNGYKSDYQMWEINILGRKCGVIMACEVARLASGEVQVLVLLLILGWGLYVTRLAKPYSINNSFNTLESRSLLANTIFIYNGMFYITGNHYGYMDKKIFKYIFFVTILFPDIGYYYYWYQLMKTEILKVVIQQNETVFRFLTFGNTNVKEFYEKHIVHENSEEEESDNDDMQINTRKLKTIPGTDYILKSSRISGIEQLKIFGFDDLLTNEAQNSKPTTKRKGTTSRRDKQPKPSEQIEKNYNELNLQIKSINNKYLNQHSRESSELLDKIMKYEVLQIKCLESILEKEKQKLEKYERYRDRGIYDPLQKRQNAINAEKEKQREIWAAKKKSKGSKGMKIGQSETLYKDDDQDSESDLPIQDKTRENQFISQEEKLDEDRSRDIDNSVDPLTKAQVKQEKPSTMVKQEKQKPDDFLKAEKDRILKEGLIAPQQIDFSFIQPGQNLDFLKKKEERPDYEIFKVNKRKAQKHNVEFASPLQKQRTMKKVRSKSKKQNQTMFIGNEDSSGVKPFDLNQHKDMSYQEGFPLDGNQSFDSPMIHNDGHRGSNKPLMVNQFMSNDSSQMPPKKSPVPVLDLDNVSQDY